MSLALLLGPQLKAFAEAGYEVIGASPTGPHVADLEASGIRHVGLRHLTRSSAPHKDVAALAELCALFRRLRPHVVHVHNPKPGICGRLAAWATGVPAVVNTVHGLYAQPTDPWVKRTTVYRLERLAARCSSAELVQNEEDLAVLTGLGVPVRKLRLLGNGIDLARFDPARVPAAAAAALRNEVGAGPDDVLCVLVGRLVAEKGFLDAFTAVAMLSKRLPGLRVVVVGPEEPEKSDGLTARDLERAVRAGVRFLGFRRDVETVYAAADLFVLASHREGFPRSAMEAAAMGLPVLATDVRGCRQVVDHEVTGLLVPPKAPVELADSIARLASDADLRRRFGAAGSLKARREFDQERVIEITLDTYEHLLRRAPTVEMR